ncbi:hypothetical protein HYU19_06010 [Candidatus Woesearchaeota archaeon]|nr:hypothetical protein [Candidatus Woesearchaeota archaeon]
MEVNGFSSLVSTTILTNREEKPLLLWALRIRMRDYPFVWDTDASWLGVR